MLYKKKRERKRKWSHVLAVWFVGLACLGTLVIGQVDPTQANGATPAAPEPVAAEEPTADAPEAGMEILDENGGAIQTLSFRKDMTIQEALRFLAMKYQKNIVPTPRVEGIVTVTNLYDVSFEEALQAIIGVNKWEEQGNFIMVYTPEEYEQIKADKRRMEVRLFTLYYLTADEAKKLVTAVLSPDGTIATSSPAKTGVPTGDSIAAPEGGDNLAYQDSLVVQDYPEKLEQVEALLAEIDLRPQQVLVEATILSATLTEGMDLGVDLNFANGTTVTGVSQVGDWNQSGTPLEVAGFATTGQAGLRIGISSGDISMFISALEQVTDVTVMANPKILAINKQLGQVYIGTKLGYREGDVETAAGGTQVGAVKFLDTGTKLSFRPYIGNDGFIRMDIHPKDSTGELNANDVPNETSAELATNVIVRDGETVVIGGLFRDAITGRKSQVPLLGDIPVVGALFQGRSDETKRQEVIVLLTPHIIEDPQELKGDERIEDVQRKRYGARERMSWLSVSRLAEESYTKAAGLYARGDSVAALEELNWALHLRPTYLEALRLRDRIVTNDLGSADNVLERIMIQAIEAEDYENWYRF